MEKDGRRLTPHLVRSIFDRRKTENIVREIALHQAADAIAKPSTEPITKDKPMAANTGARGFAAMMKAEAERLKNEFSRLHDDTKAEIDQMNGHLQTGKENLAQLKTENAELREAFGLENDTNKS